jgi:putative spermidine/putrescine transport system ATP-binding protein
LEARGFPKAEISHKVRRALDMVQLAAMGERRPAQLSGGQQQRIAVARALIYEPALVLMDEPLGALDKQLREQMQLEVKHIHDRLGLTFVYVTHDQSEALTISDRIAVFNKGRIEQLATPSLLYEAPNTVFVAQFLGETNCLSGVVRDVSEERCSVHLDNGITVLAYPVDPLKAGDLANICLRPEAIELGLRNPALSNTFDGVVQERIYLGDHLRVRVRIRDRYDLFVSVQRKPGLTLPEVGKACVVNWWLQDCRAFHAKTHHNG